MSIRKYPYHTILSLTQPLARRDTITAKTSMKPAAKWRTRLTDDKIPDVVVFKESFLFA